MARRVEHSYIFSKSIDDALLRFFYIFIVTGVVSAVLMNVGRWMGLWR
jgi:hypothetical protein